MHALDRPRDAQKYDVRIDGLPVSIENKLRQALRPPPAAVAPPPPPHLPPYKYRHYATDADPPYGA
eukprot:7161005-Pyramimonas_sp.AAC.1